MCKFFILIMACLMVFPAGPLIWADTLHLKNGSVVRGLITREAANAVELDIGGGSVIFSRAEIGRIEMSSPEEREAWIDLQTEKRKSAFKMDGAMRLQRQKSLEEWRIRTMEEEKLKKADERERQRMDANTRRAPVTVDKGGHLLAEVRINGNFSVAMIVDTGAPIVVLTQKAAQAIGLKPENMSKAVNVKVLNGEHKAFPVLLKSVQLGEALEQNVPAFVFLEDDQELSDTFKGGLLGLSFLSRFHIALDSQKGVLLLRKDGEK